MTSSAYLESYGVVLRAREQWMRTGSDADRARFDAVERAFRARFDCSDCSGGICQCTFTPSEAPHSDATDTVHRFDSQPQELPMPLKTFTQHLHDCGGDVREAERRFHADGFESRRPTTSTTRLDAGEAESAARIRSLTSWCRTDQERKQVQAKLAEQAARDAERKRHVDRVRIRMDAKTPDCKSCSEPLHSLDVEDGHDECASCRADSAQRAQKQRSARAWRKPLQVSKPGYGHDPEAA